jgi:hypothetical protein
VRIPLYRCFSFCSYVAFSPSLSLSLSLGILTIPATRFPVLGIQSYLSETRGGRLGEEGLGLEKKKKKGQGATGARRYRDETTGDWLDGIGKPMPRRPELAKGSDPGTSS